MGLGKVVLIVVVVVVLALLAIWLYNRYWSTPATPTSDVMRLQNAIEGSIDKFRDAYSEQDYSAKKDMYSKEAAPKRAVPKKAALAAYAKKGYSSDPEMIAEDMRQVWEGIGQEIDNLDVTCAPPQHMMDLKQKLMDGKDHLSEMNRTCARTGGKYAHMDDANKAQTYTQGGRRVNGNGAYQRNGGNGNGAYKSNGANGNGAYQRNGGNGAYQRNGNGAYKSNGGRANGAYKKKAANGQMMDNIDCDEFSLARGGGYCLQDTDQGQKCFRTGNSTDGKLQGWWEEADMGMCDGRPTCGDVMLGCQGYDHTDY